MGGALLGDISDGRGTPKSRSLYLSNLIRRVLPDLNLPNYSFSHTLTISSFAMWSLILRLVLMLCAIVCATTVVNSIETVEEAGRLTCSSLAAV